MPGEHTDQHLPCKTTGPVDRARRERHSSSRAPRTDQIAIVIVTLDGHLGRTIERVESRLQAEVPGLRLSLHSASDWMSDEHALADCHRAIAEADIILCTMLFMDPHIQAVLPQLQARAGNCDAIVGAMADAQIVKLTRLGKLDFSREARGPMAYLRKLRRPPAGKPSQDGGDRQRSSARSQMRTLRLLPRILKYIPGGAQDLRCYFLILQCWLAGSDVNIANLIRLLIRRYAAGPREALRERVRERALIDYPETGLYHPRMQNRIGDNASRLPEPAHADVKGTVGLLLMRSYVLAENTKHYDAVIDAFEAAGLRVIPAFASGLDARPAIEAYFREGSEARIDCLVSLTGFSLVGGPAYNDAPAAQAALMALDVPYIAAHASEFQSLSQWQDSRQGLTPIETTLMVAIPELDGACGSLIYAGHETANRQADADKMPIPDRVERLVQRVGQQIRLRETPRAERRLGIVLFNFPPNAGAIGTAAHLAVFESLHNTLTRLASEGYRVEVPESVDALRRQLLEGNAERHGTDANVLCVIPTDDHVRDTPWLEDIESSWGPAPGRQSSNSHGLLIQGLQLGNVTLVVQPGFGLEGDPMRLLFDGGCAPTHAFTAFYRHLLDTLDVHALLHFGTHGALEFMAGKQSGLSGDCWPERLIGAAPNIGFYACNNPSEATIAKRRSAATLISHRTPIITQAGLYRGLEDLKVSLNEWQQLQSRSSVEARELRELIREQAIAIDLADEADFEQDDFDARVSGLQSQLLEVESEFIPDGMHVIGQVPTQKSRAELLHAFQLAADGPSPSLEEVQNLLQQHETGDPLSQTAANEPGQIAESSAPPEWQQTLLRMNGMLCGDHELSAMIHALDGGYTPAAPGGDVLKSADTLPTGRNIHGFAPFRMPTPLAQRLGRRQADALLARFRQDRETLPECIAFVLWGSDNMKNEGIPVSQVLALLGAVPRFDNYGKICGAELLPLDTLGRARVDVMVTLSGVFRDLLPLQTRMLAEAAWLAARADEPLELNPVRRHSLAYARARGCDLQSAALRVFSNDDGAYGANVNHLIDSGCWSEESELAETYASRKCFAYHADGRVERQREQLQALLADVDAVYQNLESHELGVTQLDYYFDTLGGINAMARQTRKQPMPTYIGDQTRGEDTVRTLQQQVALEARSRMLNPKWYEGQLRHGHEGVRSIEQTVTNTLGLSATTGHVSDWVYTRMAETFILDESMRNRLAELNPRASSRLANRLIEAQERHYWNPDDALLQALHDAGDDLEDRLEGVYKGFAA